MRFQRRSNVDSTFDYAWSTIRCRGAFPRAARATLTGMVTLLSHTTALECWRSGRFDALLAPRPLGGFRRRPIGFCELVRDADAAAKARCRAACEARAFFATSRAAAEHLPGPRASDVRAVRQELGFLSEPLHVLVASAAARDRCARVRCHVCSRPLPPGSFVRLGDRLYASSPELCFVQMATVLPFVELVKLGFELCGTYAERLDGATRYDRSLLLTSVAALARFVDSAGDIPGVVAARKAVKLLVACSASPRETALTILLCLPLRRGGYGLPSPELNFRIDVGRSKRAVTDKGYYLCDLYWREARIDLEYESDERHTGAERIAEDSMRRDDLAHLGVKVRTMTNRQMVDPVRFDKAARQLASALGVRIREQQGCPAARRALRKVLLRPSSTGRQKHGRDGGIGCAGSVSSAEIRQVRDDVAIPLRE